MTVASVLGLDVTTDVLVPTITAALAVVVALVARHLQLRDKRRDDLRALFSDALAAIATYEELPYLVRRRSDAPPMTSAELTWHASQVQTRLDYFVARLELEATELGSAYELLVRAARQETGAHVSEAWGQPRITADTEMPLGSRYPRDAVDAQRTACLAVMQSHLGRAWRRPVLLSAVRGLATHGGE